MAAMKMTRIWAMPNANTFDVQPIGDFVRKYMRNAKVSIDPFARNKGWATYTNDLSPDTTAQYHMRASDFLDMLVEQGVKADLVIFDPPYSLRQAKEVYESVGDWKFEDTQEVGRWTREKDACSKLLNVGGVFLYFGWNTSGMGKDRNCEIEEVLLVCHGSAHHDTICMAERKTTHQGELFDAP